MKVCVRFNLKKLSYSDCKFPWRFFFMWSSSSEKARSSHKHMILPKWMWYLVWGLRVGKWNWDNWPDPDAGSLRRTLWSFLRTSWVLSHDIAHWNPDSHVVCQIPLGKPRLGRQAWQNLILGSVTITLPFMPWKWGWLCLDRVGVRSWWHNTCNGCRTNDSFHCCWQWCDLQGKLSTCLTCSRRVHGPCCLWVL